LKVLYLCRWGAIAAAAKLSQHQREMDLSSANDSTIIPTRTVDSRLEFVLGEASAAVFGWTDREISSLPKASWVGGGAICGIKLKSAVDT